MTRRLVPEGTRYPVEEAERRDPDEGGFWLFLPVLLLVGLVRLVFKHPYIVALAGITAAVWSVAGVWGVLAAYAAFVAFLAFWKTRWPRSFSLRVLVPSLGVVRGFYYRRRWRRVMFAAGLDDGCHVTRWTPRVIAVRASLVADAVWVRPLATQTVDEWRGKAAELAALLGTGPIRMDEDEGGRLRLVMARDARFAELPVLAAAYGSATATLAAHDQWPDRRQLVASSHHNATTEA